jgi:hypothetical protein
MPDIVHDIELRIDGTARRDQSGGVARKKERRTSGARVFFSYFPRRLEPDAGRGAVPSPRPAQKAAGASLRKPLLLLLPAI